VNWLLAPQTKLIFGYQYTEVNFTGDEQIRVDDIVGFGGLMSSDRDYRSHYGYAGVDHSFSPDLSGALRAGVRFTEQINTSGQPTDTSPYVSAGLTYRQSADTTIGLNFSHDLSVSDVVGNDPNTYVRGKENSVAAISLMHRLSPALSASLVGTYQYSEYIGGTGIFDGAIRTVYPDWPEAGISINQHLALEAGYSFDHVESDLNRGYDRNRYDLGVTASY